MALKKVLVNFIQDRSGSMQSVWDETLSGFKSFVTKLRDSAKDDGIEYTFSLTTFDTIIETPVVGKPIADIDTDVLKAHGPRGSTALYDAVGITIKNTEDNRHGAEKIICVIVTDGHENSSREWDKNRLHSAIESKLNAGDWTFTYLGTQPETWGDAQTIGVAAASSATYVGQHANAAYTVTADALRSFSKSSQMGTRSLMAHASPRAAQAARMCIRTGDTQTKKPAKPGGTKPNKPTTRPSNKDSRRWR